MNELLAHWKLFAVFLLLGLFAALGIRSKWSDAPPPAAAPESAPAEPPAPGDAPAEPAPAKKGLLVDLGNELCPINKGAVDGSTYVEWNHLRVAFCCPGCDRKFLAAPEEALEEAGIDWKPVRKAIDDYLSAPAEHKAHMLAALRREHKIIREP